MKKFFRVFVVFALVSVADANENKEVNDPFKSPNYYTSFMIGYIGTATNLPFASSGYFELNANYLLNSKKTDKNIISLGGYIAGMAGDLYGASIGACVGSNLYNNYLIPQFCTGFMLNSVKSSTTFTNIPTANFDFRLSSMLFYNLGLSVKYSVSTPFKVNNKYITSHSITFGIAYYNFY